ncbi:MAG: hypothetical protein IJU48_09470 [Synergistaceae bacterium]|nr:hypothetical protein [Synergistaceae bacterium]
MKRLFMFALVIALVLVSSAVFAERQEFTDFSVDVPQGWTAVEGDGVDVRGAANRRNVIITNSTNADRSVEVFVDTKRDAAGDVLNITQVANTWFNRLNGNNQVQYQGGWQFSYVRTGNVASLAFVFDNNLRNFQGNAVNSTPPDGYYTIVRGTANVSIETFFGIINSITYHPGTGSNGIPGGGGSGGGCNTGAGLLALLVMFSAVKLYGKR